MRFKLKSVGLVLALICGFAVTTPTPSRASTVSFVSAAAAASFSSTGPCNVVNAPATATCSDSSALEHDPQTAAEEAKGDVR